MFKKCSVQVSVYSVKVLLFYAVVVNYTVFCLQQIITTETIGETSCQTQLIQIVLPL